MATATQILGVKLQYSHTMGRSEMSGTGFRQPISLARGQDDLVYVVSRGYDYRPESRRVTMLTVDEDFVGQFSEGAAGKEGQDPNEIPEGAMVWPTSIAIDQDGKVYIADEWLNRITIFSADGGEILGHWGTVGSGDGEIKNPAGMVFDKDNNLLVVDSGNNRIQKFTTDGKFLGKWGQAGSAPGQLNMPWGIALDTKGDVFIADWRNDRIQKFTANGQFLMGFGSSGNENGQFDRPTGVAVDREGYIYVTDWGNDRLQVFDGEGNFLTKSLGEGGVSKWGKAKLDANPEMWKERANAQDLERERLFWSPVDVKVDAEGRIFVLESERNRIQVFRRQAPMFVGSRL